MNILVLGKKDGQSRDLLRDLTSWGFSGMLASDAAEAGGALAQECPPRIMLVLPESAADVSALTAVQDELPVFVAVFLIREGDKEQEAQVPPGALAFPLSASRLSLAALLSLARSLVQAREELDETREEMKRLSIIDQETGLDSRTHFLTQGRTEVSRCIRYRRSLSVMVLDMDHFRKSSAEMGREKARKAFADFAAACRHNLRGNDIIGRLGEDSLAVLLPEADAKNAFLVAEKLRNLTENLIVDSPAGPPLTASIGIATLMLGDQSFEKLIQRAEKALDQAKALGGNRVATG